jgi:hypothetical protein
MPNQKRARKAHCSFGVGIGIVLYALDPDTDPDFMSQCP